MSEPIVFYDIPSKVEGIAWSPNTWKIRFALNYKGLSYRTVWVEYPDIEPAMKEIGAAATTTWDDGSPWYTLPAIHDPNTKTTLSESGIIARYLDKAYPETPVLIPAGTSALHAAFQSAVYPTVSEKMFALMLPPTNGILNPRSEAFFRRTREVWFGKLEEWAPPGPKREKYWAEFAEGMSKVAGWMSLDGQDAPFFMGDRITFADITIAGWLVWIKKVLGPDHEEWVRLQTLDGGRWGKFMQAFEKYETVG